LDSKKIIQLEKNLWFKISNQNSSRVFIIFDEIPNLDLSFYVRWACLAQRLDPKSFFTRQIKQKCTQVNECTRTTFFASLHHLFLFLSLSLFWDQVFGGFGHRGFRVFDFGPLNLDLFKDQKLGM
jgi:hypothetical protein